MMKRSDFFNVDLEARFNEAKMDDSQMNFLHGGDGDGGQGSSDPWKPPE